MSHPERHELRMAIESLPVFSDTSTLDDKDALALLTDAKEKLPRLESELREQAERLVEEIESRLGMRPEDEVTINDNILRSIVNLVLKVGAAQVLFDAGVTIQEIRVLREQFHLPPSDTH